MIAVRQEALGLAKDGTTLLGPALPHLLARHGKRTPGGRGGGGCNGHHKLFAAGADKATVAKRHTGKRTTSGKENAGSADPRTQTHARQRRRRRRRRRGKPPNRLATPRGHRQQVPAALRPIGWGSPPRPRTCAGQQPEGPGPGPPLVHQAPGSAHRAPGLASGPARRPSGLALGPRAPASAGLRARSVGPRARPAGPRAQLQVASVKLFLQRPSSLTLSLGSFSLPFRPLSVPPPFLASRSTPTPGGIGGQGMGGRVDGGVGWVRRRRRRSRVSDRRRRRGDAGFPHAGPAPRTSPGPARARPFRADSEASHGPGRCDGDNLSIIQRLGPSSDHKA